MGTMRLSAKAACTLAVATTLIASAAAAAPPAPTPVAGTPFMHRHATDTLGRDISYYVAEGRPGAPILLMIQGSGCMPVFLDDGAGHNGSTVFNALPYATQGRFTVVLVDKPFAHGSLQHMSGTADACGDAFNRNFTAERWLAALEAGLKGAQTGRPHGRVLVFGTSEGAVMGAMLAGHDDSVTDVVGVGMTGASQMFDFTVLDDAQPGTAADHVAALEGLDAEVKAIAAKPDSINDFAWGHPFRRWSSFFKVSATDELMKSRARVYLVSGTDDQAVPIASTEIAFTTLRAHGRDVTMRRVAGAGHGLQTPGADGYKQTGDEFDRALRWFWGAPEPSP